MFTTEGTETKEIKYSKRKIEMGERGQNLVLAI